MPASRRQFLVGSGLAAASGVSFWQRRRITRYPELEEMRAARERAVPTFEAGVPVADAHLESSYERTLDALEAAQSAVDDDRRYAPGPEEIADYEPEKLADASRTERRDALESLRRQARRAARTVAGVRYEDGRLERTDIDERVEDERTALAGVDAPYRGASLTDAVVANGLVDERRRDARSHIESADDERVTGETEHGRAWGRLAAASAHRRDAAWHLRSIDGDDYAERMERTLEDAMEAVEASREAVEWEYDGKENYAFDASISSDPMGGRMYGSSSAEMRRDEGYLASGVQLAAHRYTFFESLESFAEIPSRRRWNDLGWAVDATELPARKRAAVDAVEAALGRVGDDPLARWLLADAVARLERADERLERGIVDVNDAGDERWRRSSNEYYVRCLGAEAFAARVPETMATLFE